MTVALSGTGGIATRLGRIGGLIRNVNGFRGIVEPIGDNNDTGALWGASGPTARTLGKNFDLIAAEFQSALQYVVDGLYASRDSAYTSMGKVLTDQQKLAATILVEQVHADTKLPKKTIVEALKVLISQISAASASINANTVTASTAAASGNTGDGVVSLGVVDGYGKTTEYAFTETVDFEVTADSYTGGATAGKETALYTGDVAESDMLSQNWPRGSACSGKLTVRDASTVSDSHNLLTNGDWEDDWTSTNTPGTWTIAVGAAATDIFDGTTSAYKGSHCLKLTGTGGSPLSQLYQDVTALLEPNTVYAVNLWIKDSGAGLTAGVVQFDLHDGSAVINDDAGTANSSTRAFSDTTASFVARNFQFRTPKVLSNIIRFRIAVTTALTSGASMFIDHVCLTPAVQLYTGGPFGAMFSGATKFLLKDKITGTITNSYDGLLQCIFWRLFDMAKLGLIVPSNASGAETVADTLVA